MKNLEITQNCPLVSQLESQLDSQLEFQLVFDLESQLESHLALLSLPAHLAFRMAQRRLNKPLKDFSRPVKGLEKAF